MNPLLILFPLLLTLAHATTLSETVTIPRTSATLTRTSITFQPTNTIPLLRSLTLSLRNKTATSPYLADAGTFTRTNTAITITFPSPSIIISLSIIKSNPLTVRGKATHTFPQPPGLHVYKGRQTVEEGVKAVTDELKSGTFRTIAVIDHAKAAADVGLKLAPSTVIVFGNPVVGSRLWLQNPKAGIELPLKLLIAASPLGTVYVSWSRPEVLVERFNLVGLDELGETVGALFAKLGSLAAGRKLNIVQPGLEGVQGGIQTVRGGRDAGAAFGRLVEAVGTPPLRIAFEFLYDKLAVDGGVNIMGRVEKLVVFGNANVGTSVMQRRFTAAIDLPLKMVVWTRKEGGRVVVGYTRPRWIARRHKVLVPDVLDAALRRLAGVALGV